jgi:8-oxo-dGTP pyrophosphatase MutT (NUDIX family)
VLAILRDQPGGIETLLIERAVREGDLASGQVGLPGGRVEPGDRSLGEAALRETREEIGVLAGDLVRPPVFVLRAPARAFRLEVAVFAAELSTGASDPEPRDPTEVAGVFWFPLRELSVTTPVVRETFRGPATVEAHVHEGHVLWGFTRSVLRELFPPNGESPP